MVLSGIKSVEEENDMLTEKLTALRVWQEKQGGKSYY